MTIAGSLSLTLFPAKSSAFEPLSLLTGIIGPVVCKMIQCKTEVNKYLFVERPEENIKRLKEMRDNFKWDDYYEKGDCKSLDNNILVCYDGIEWRVEK